MPDRSQYIDEEPPSPPKKPKGVQPAGKLEKRIAKAISLILAASIWCLVKDNLKEASTQEISGMQSQAEEKGAPLIIDTTSSTITAKVAEVITGKEEPKNTVIINLPGVGPAIQVITPDATISAGKTGEIEQITSTRNTTKKPLTETEAKQTVVKAIQNAAEKTLPKEELVAPLTPKKD